MLIVLKQSDLKTSKPYFNIFTTAICKAKPGKQNHKVVALESNTHSVAAPRSCAPTIHNTAVNMGLRTLPISAQLTPRANTTDLRSTTGSIATEGMANKNVLMSGLTNAVSNATLQPHRQAATIVNK